MGVIKKHLDDFYHFMYERQSIWFRRNVLRNPPPWTKDPILRDLKFTNVYRELDHGTIWYMAHVYPEAVAEARNYKASREQCVQIGQHNLLWCTIIYRLLNRVETFEKVGFVPYLRWKWGARSWLQELRKMHKKESVFTSAHLTLPVGVGNAGKSRIDKFAEVLYYVHSNLETLHDKLLKAPSLEKAFWVLREIPCVGPFIAYEIVCDLMMVKMIPFTENDWANAGPGCRVGIRIIFPKTKGDEEFLERIRQLRDDQYYHFRRLGLKFPYYHPGQGLSLRSIEHSLCEYAKYWKAKRGVGKARIIFCPRDWPDSRGQLPFRFPRLADDKDTADKQ